MRSRGGKNNYGLILVGTLLLFAVFLLLFLQSGKTQGKTLVITKEGEEIIREPLREGAVYRVGSEKEYNMIRVERDAEGSMGVRCFEADCPEQVCVEKGLVVLTDDPIVCLPHQVTVRLITE